MSGVGGVGGVGGAGAAHGASGGGAIGGTSPHQRVRLVPQTMVARVAWPLVIVI